MIPINEGKTLKNLSMTGESNLMKQLHPDEEAWMVPGKLNKIIINV